MKRAIATTILAATGLFGLAGTAQATPGEPHRITLCHATHSESNPYVTITVDVASVKFEGHDSHEGPVWYPGAKADGVTWGDVIPAFGTADGYPFDYPGKNVPEGQSFLDNGCEYVGESPTPTTPPPTSTTPPTTPPETTTPPTRTTVLGRHSANPKPHRLTAFTGTPTWPIAGLVGFSLLGLGSLALARRKSGEVAK
jgi:hypothetical protein